MGVSYTRLWKKLIDKNMKRIEMQHLTGISAVSNSGCHYFVHYYKL